MGKSGTARSFLEQLADYDDPTPKEFDPENDQVGQYGLDAESKEDEGAHQEEARDHYADVEKSSLRNSNGIELGSHYSGLNVSRDAFENGDTDNSEDEPFESQGKYGEFDEQLEMQEEDEIVGSSVSHSNKDDMEEEEDNGSLAPEAFGSSSSLSSEDGEDEDEDEDGNDSQSISSTPPPLENDRSALRKMMAEEQKSVAASLSAAAKGDIAKGKAIKTQHATFDSLLNTRIKLQKALIATNSMHVVRDTSNSDSTDMGTDFASASCAAEEAALKLLDSITSIRNSLYPNGTKRPFSPTTETSSQTLQNEVTHFDNEARTLRRATLSKWSQRTNPVVALRPQNRFSQAPPQQPLTSVIDQQLTGENMERAIKRTRVARSCAPIQAASKVAVDNEDIYDDADFYSLLLRELVDRRMADVQSVSANASMPDVASIIPSRAELKVKKHVDTKASKGRKMRYTVHEKLQNFMAAEDRGSWGERQRAELFGSLLGRKVEMGEVDGFDEEMDDDGIEDHADGLKLFAR